MKESISRKDLFDVYDKVALITGASSGIGLHLCSMLLERGCKVIGASRTATKATDLEHLSGKYGNVFGPAVQDYGRVVFCFPRLQAHS